MDVGVAEAGSTGLAVVQTTHPPVHPPTTTLRDLGLLLHVDVDQLARPGGLDPTDDPAAPAVEVGEPAHPVTLEYPVEGRGRHVEPRGQAGRPQLVAPPQLDDAALHALRGLG